MAGDRLVVGEVGQARTCVCRSVVRRLIQNLPGIDAVDRAGAAIGAGRAGLFLGRQAPDLEIAAHQRVERVRQLRRG